MKKMAKRTVAVLGGLLLLLVLAWAGLMGRVSYEQSKMHPLETSHVDSLLYVVRVGHGNVYLLKGTTGYVAIDAGDDSAVLARGLNQLGVDAALVHTVLFTHSDADHVNGRGVFTKARFYMPAGEAPLLDGSVSRMLLMYNTLDNTVWQGFPQSDVLDVDGLHIERIASPGHTPGHSCYRVGKTGIFVGDALALGSGRAQAFNTFFDMDAEAAASSLAKLRPQLKGAQVYTSHYGKAAL